MYMLTKNDLQQIGELLDTKLEEKLEEKLEPIKKEQKQVKKKLNKMSNDINLVVRTFDKDIMQNRKRIERLEDHVDLPPMASM